MKTSNRFSFFYFLLLFFFLSGSTAYAIGYPHYLQNGLSCDSCHTTSSSEPRLMPPWTSNQVPQDIDDTQFNKLCWSCHQELGSAPYVVTHSSRNSLNDYGNWTVECRVCHEPHFQMQARTYNDDFMAEGISTGITATTLTMSDAGWIEDEFAGMILIPNKNYIDFSYKILSNTSDTITVDPGVAVGDPETMNLYLAHVGDLFAVSYAKLIRSTIDRSRILEYATTDPLGENINTRTGLVTVKLIRPTGVNSFVDGDSTFNGVCEICHTQTNHFRNTGEVNIAPGGYDHNEAVGTHCIKCHNHSNGFLHGKGASGSQICVQCHGHDAGSNYDPDMAYPPVLQPGTASIGAGSSWSHSTHTEYDGNDKIGPRIYCNVCHDTDNMPTFKNQDGSGGHTLEETNICNNCHSPGGSYNGVNSTNGSIGAKDNWHIGVYDEDAEGKRFLKPGNEKWCAGCHDEEPSNTKWNGEGITAPVVIGDEDAEYGYGTGWGFYKTGHGLETGFYPASGAPAANVSCNVCHDASAEHLDNIHRTYQETSHNYQAGYRLRDVDGEEPMNIPLVYREDAYALCSQCHDTASLIDSSDMTTNYRGSKNAHQYHLAMGGTWDSDWDMVTDAKVSCPTCHNVHGSESPRMMRHGELISTPGTIDKVPALNFQYRPVETPPVTLADSTGGRMNGGGVEGTGVCGQCHSISVIYTRDPHDLYTPVIEGVYGTPGSDVLAVTFSKPVYTNTGASGALVAADFALTDVDDGRTVSGVTHTAGEDFALLTLSTSLDGTGDIDVDTLGAATNASIYYRNYGGVDIAMGTDTVVVTGDATAPVISNLDPEDIAIYVSADSNLTFTLTDEESGIDWSSFQIELTSDGYAETYTDLDTAIVTKTGSPTSYDVTVNPSVDFPNGEIITVTVNVNNNLGNAMTSPSWSFVTAAGGQQQTVKLHPSGLAAEGDGGFELGGIASGWDTALDYTSILYYVKKTGDPGTFYVDMDDPVIEAGATIHSVSVHAVAKDYNNDTVDVGYKTGTGVIWKGAISIRYDTNTTVSLVAPTNSDNGAWTLTDLNNLKVAFTRNSVSADDYTNVYEIYVVINYTPWNTEPIVDAGDDQEIFWPDDTADLDGMVTDDGQPVAATLAWTKVSGPGTVNFVPGNAAVTTATFSEPGTYVLRLTADDTLLNDSDEVTVMVQDDVPTAPVIKTSAGVDANTIRWNFTDTSDSETGFRVHDAGHQEKADSATRDLTYLDETGLVANTQYTRHVLAYNGVGVSACSGEAAAYTLAVSPNVKADRNDTTWYNIADVHFTNTAGFGAGGVEYYRYVWDRNATHAFDDTETKWTGDTLVTTATVDGSWYLHVKSYNGDDVGSGSQDYGPFNYDSSGPEASVLTPDDGATNAHIGGNVRLTLSDTGSGVDMTSFTIELSGDQGYSATYTYDDSGNVSASGTPASYAVTVNPDTDFTDGEVITVTVTVLDNLLNAMTSPSWSFTTTTDVGSGTLGNCTPVSIITGGSAEWVRRAIDVPAGATDLTVTKSGSNGYAYLYVRFDLEPTADDYDCYKWWGDTLSCEFAPPSTGIYHIGVYGWFPDGVQLEACYRIPLNSSPDVEAGDNQNITWPTNTVSLDGTVTDDGLPDPPATVTKAWIKISGPGTVSFDPAGSEDTTATFSEPGTYVLRLMADDGALNSYDEMTVTVAAESVPDAPTIPTGTVLSANSIQWNFTCTADNETGFKLHDTTQQEKASAATPDLESFVETGLAPNTPYTRHVHAYNDNGDSAGSGDSAVVYTWAASPNVTADKTVATWYETADVVFTNAAGFGPGGVQYYRYVWDQNATHAFTDAETQWTGGTLAKTAADEGSWYLHVKAYNIEGIAGDTQDYGPYNYDETDPAASALSPANVASNVTNSSNLTVTLSDAGSGIDWTSFEIQLSGDQSYSETYTDENTGNVSKTGTPASYVVTVDPATNFALGEEITVTVSVNDNAGHALATPDWSFTVSASLLTVDFSSPSQSVAEDVGTVTITAELSTTTGTDVTVPFTVSGTATAGGTDHDLADGNIIIIAGQLNGTTTFTVNDDSLDENDETVILTMGTPVGADAGAIDVHTVTITDNDPTPSVAFTSASQAVDETGGSVTITAELSAASGLDVTMPFTVSGTATGGGTDHDLADGNIIITAGQLTGSTSFNVIDDEDEEGNETVIATMGTPVNAIQGGITVHTVTIQDNEGYITVCSSGCDHYTIQAAIDAAASLDTVQVYDGTYPENLTINNKDITLVSVNGPALTIIDGSDAGPVITISNGDTSTIDGFTIRNGSTTSGGGIYINSSDTTVQHCVISSNTVSTYGGGIYVQSSGSVTVTDSDISGNNAGYGGGMTVGSGTTATISNTDFDLNTSSSYGGAIYSYGPVTITGGSFTNNDAGSEGGVVYITGAALTIDGSTLDNNEGSYGGAISARSGSTIDISNAVISNNTSSSYGTIYLYGIVGDSFITNTTIKDNSAGSYGGGICYYSSGTGGNLTLSKSYVQGNSSPGHGGGLYLSSSAVTTIINSMITGNRTHDTSFRYGGGIYNYGNLTMMNSTVSGNYAYYYGGGLYAGGTETITNSIIWGNVAGTASSTNNIYSTINSATYSDIEGGYTGTGNVDLDPNFEEFVQADNGAATSGGDFHIQAASNVIDLGTATGASDDDIDGQARPQDSGIDMGADEYLYVVTNNTITKTATAEGTGKTTIDVSMPYTRDDNGDNSYTVDYKLSSEPTVWTNWVTEEAHTASPYITTITVPVAEETYDVRMTYNDADGVTGDAVQIVSNIDLTIYADLTTASQTVAEDVGTVTVTATLSLPNDVDVTVPFTVSGTAEDGGIDHNLADGNIIVTAGETTGIIQFNVNDDSLDEPDETVIVTMGTPVNATTGTYTVHTVTITDNDPEPYVNFNSIAQSTVDESGEVTIRVNLSDGSGRDVSVPFTVNGASTATGGGTDYTIDVSPLVIPSGSLSGEITVTVATDSDEEGDETVIVDMGTPTYAIAGTTTSHTLTITDDDVLNVNFSSASQTVVEGDTVTVEATLNQTYGSDVTVPFTVSGTATAGGTDHDLADGNIIITAGQLTGSTSFSVTDDATPEGSETVILTMGSPTYAARGATTVHTVTISASDATQVKTVCDSACDYPTIQAAIDASSSGWLIRVSDGTYTENLTINNKDIILESVNGAASTIIDGDSSGRVIYLSSGDTSTIDGFTIQNGTYTDGAGLYIFSSNTTVQNCIVTGNTVSNKGGAIFVTGSGAGVTAANTTFSGNSANYGGAISLDTGTSAVISNSDFDLNSSTYYGGAVWASSATVDVSGGSFTDNEVSTYEGGAIYITGSTADLTMDGTTLTNNEAIDGGAISVKSGATVDIDNSVIDSNISGDTGGAVYMSSPGSTPSISNTSISGNISTNDGAGIYLVSSTSTTLTLEDVTIDRNQAVGTSSGGGGLYLNSSSVTATITGGSISDNIAGDDGGGLNAYTISGLTINGTTIAGNEAVDMGGGLYIYYMYGDTNISNASITGNTSADNGGGLYFYSTSAVNLTLTNTDLSSNTAGGWGGNAYINGGSTTATMTGCTINSGYGTYGAALYISSSVDLTIEDSELNDNRAAYSGGAIYLYSSGAVLTMSESVVQGNSAGYDGGGLYVYSSGATETLTNCLITGNNTRASSRKGGGIYNSGTLTLMNSTISGNYASLSGGGLYANGTETITNSIIWGNTNGSISGTADTVSYSDIEGGYTGTGNIDLDPGFVSLVQATSSVATSGGDFHIQTGSNVIDQGTLTGAPTVDIEGDSRPQGAGIDMGADEYVP